MILDTLSDGVQLISLNGIKYIRRSRSVNEIKILEILKNHNGFERLVSVEVNESPISCNTEFVEGSTLCDFLTTGYVSMGCRSQISYSLIESVRLLHSLNIFHGDLNFDNVMIDKRLQPIIIDFGHSNDETMSSFYNPPEYFSNDNWKNSRSNDLWCLGILLFRIWSDDELPTGCWFCMSINECLESYKDPSTLSFRNGIPPKIRDIVIRLLDHNPSTRSM